MRKVKSHVKPEIVVGKRESGEDIILDVKIWSAYSDERVMLKEMLREREWRSKFIMADALYGMDVEVLREFYRRAEKVVVPVRDTIHTRVKHPLMVQAKRDYEENRERYKERNIVERTIGKIKNAYGICIPMNSEEKARKVVWLMVILYNWALVVAFGPSFVIFIFFQVQIFLVVLWLNFKRKFDRKVVEGDF